MIDTYKGESASKKLVRLDFWRSALFEVDPRPRGSIVVLASREGGDVSTLTGMGIPPQAIVAVDRCADAAAECERRWPDARVVHGDIVDSVTCDTDVVFLDFCAPLGRETLDTSLKCLARLRVGALFGIAFLKGRENDGALGLKEYDAAKCNRSERRRLRAIVRTSKGFERAFAKALIGEEAYSARDFIGNVFDSEDQISFARFAPLQLAFPNLKALGWWMYQSATASSRGVPMTIGLFRKERPRVRNEVRGRRGHPEDFAPLRHGGDYGALGDEAVKNKALEIFEFADAHSRDAVTLASLLLSIPRSTASAWRAHHTRGTYANVG